MLIISALLFPTLEVCDDLTDCYLLPPEKRDGVPKIDGWIPMAHSHSELVGRVLDRIRRFKPDAKLSFRIRVLQTFSRQSEEPLPQDEIHVLEEYYDTFDEIFFSTALRHNCFKLEMIGAGTDEWKKMSKSEFAYTTVNSSIVLSRNKVQALIHVLERVENETHPQRMKNYIESLLHEMTHAIILVYTYSCADCSNKYKPDVGGTGHGRTWQAIAHAVEKFCFKELDLELDLDRAFGLVKDIDTAYTGMLGTLELDCALVYKHVGKLGGWIQSERGEEHPSGLDSNNAQEDNNIGHGMEESDG